MSVKFQAAPVERPLGSVMRICQAFRRFVFDADEVSYILNKKAGEINRLREDNCNYVMDTRVPPQGIKGSIPESAQEGFSRAAMTPGQSRAGVRPIEMSVGSSRGLVLKMDNVMGGNEGDGEANSEDGS